MNGTITICHSPTCAAYTVEGVGEMESKGWGFQQQLGDDRQYWYCERDVERVDD